jgi:hypothetical protein
MDRQGRALSIIDLGYAHCFSKNNKLLMTLPHSGRALNILLLFPEVKYPRELRQLYFQQPYCSLPGDPF